MTYIPTKITLTERIGFDRQVAEMLLHLAETQNRDPRELAAELLKAAIERMAKSCGPQSV